MYNPSLPAPNQAESSTLLPYVLPESQESSKVVPETQDTRPLFSQRLREELAQLARLKNRIYADTQALLAKSS